MVTSVLKERWATFATVSSATMVMSLWEPSNVLGMSNSTEQSGLDMVTARLSSDVTHWLPPVGALPTLPALQLGTMEVSVNVMKDFGETGRNAIPTPPSVHLELSSCLGLETVARTSNALIRTNVHLIPPVTLNTEFA